MDRPKTMRQWSPEAFCRLLKETKTRAREIVFILGEDGLQYTRYGVNTWRRTGNQGPPHPRVVKLIAAHLAQKGAGSEVEISTQLRGMP